MAKVYPGVYPVVYFDCFFTQGDSGDLILYQGHYMVIYYDRNSYSLTRLGKIINVTQDELKNALGKG